MRLYPSLSNSDPKTLKDALNFIARERQLDIVDRNNFPNIFVGGRKVGKVPAGSTDIATTDQEGDINYDSEHAYFAVNVGSTLTWLRASLSTW